MSKILTISGFGQRPDLVKRYLNERSDFLEYFDKKFQDIKLDKNYETVIGWSLGGAIALSLARKYNFKKIILIATPYQFVSSKDFKFGIDPKEFKKFELELNKDKKNLLKDFKDLMFLGDARKKDFYDLVTIFENSDYKYDYWLGFLENFRGEKYSGLNSEITLIYGGKDKIVNKKQADFYQKIFPNAKLNLIEKASHLPFIHPEFNEYIQE